MKEAPQWAAAGNVLAQPGRRATELPSSERAAAGRAKAQKLVLQSEAVVQQRSKAKVPPSSLKQVWVWKIAGELYSQMGSYEGADWTVVPPLAQVDSDGSAFSNISRWSRVVFGSSEVFLACVYFSAFS